MKNYLSKLLLLASAFLLSTCEKDDICEAGTPTTPRLVIEFYDYTNSITKKTVTDLAIYSPNTTNVLLFNAVSTIEVPLETISDSVLFDFVLDSKNPIVSLQNLDKIKINYTRKEVYISRACGFKTLFTLNTNNGIELIPDSDNWIKEIIIQQYDIINENEVHVKIFF